MSFFLLLNIHSFQFPRWINEEIIKSDVAQNVIENKIQSSLVYAYLKRRRTKTLKLGRKERKRWLLVWSMRTRWFTLRRKGCPAPKSPTLTPTTALIPSRYMISFFRLLILFWLFELKNEVAILDSNRKFCERYKRSRASLFSRAAERSIWGIDHCWREAWAYFVSLDLLGPQYLLVFHYRFHFVVGILV